MNNRQLERNASSAVDTLAELVAEIESLETRLLEADEEINRLNDIIDDFN